MGGGAPRGAGGRARNCARHRAGEAACGRANSPDVGDFDCSRRRAHQVRPRAAAVSYTHLTLPTILLV
eukprot:6429095-Pyramimonas_sp.AAC.1